MQYDMSTISGYFENLLSLAEAAEIWQIDESTIRKAISSGRLVDGRDCRKFGKQWVVTAYGMANTFHGGFTPWSKHLATRRREAQQAQEMYR